jgi:hypothetical protein
MDGLIQTNKEMKFELKRKYVVNEHKTLKAGQVMDVTQEKYEWLEKNGYGEPEKIKVKKETKTKKAQEEQK